MIKIEQKNIKGKPFFYLSSQINIGGRFQKIQTYLGKNIPNQLDVFYAKLLKKEVNKFY